MYIKASTVDITELKREKSLNGTRLRKMLMRSYTLPESIPTCMTSMSLVVFSWKFVQSFIEHSYRISPKAVLGCVYVHILYKVSFEVRFPDILTNKAFWFLSCNDLQMRIRGARCSCDGPVRKGQTRGVSEWVKSRWETEWRKEVGYLDAPYPKCL